MINKGMMTSSTHEWGTPQDLYNALDAEFNFTLDPCCTHENAKCTKHYTILENGLVQSWAGETVFMNPPYGREIGKWIEKAWRESQNGSVVVCLIPARTDTGWWHEYVMRGNVRFIRGRLKFGDGKNPAPFPSAICVFDKSNYPERGK